MTLSPYFEPDKLIYGSRQSGAVDSVTVDPLEADALRVGEWATLSSGKLVRPTDVGALTVAELFPLITAAPRTDVASVLKLTSLRGPGTIFRTNMYNIGTTTIEIASGADLVITADDPAATSNSLASVTGFGTAQEGDVIVITGGDYDGVSFTIGAATATGGVQDVNTIYEDTGISDNFSVTDATGPASFQILRSGVTVPAPAAGGNLVTALYQHPDNPALLVCGLIPVDATLVEAVADGTTPGLITSIGTAVVAKCLRGPARLTGVGRNGDNDVIEAMLV